MNRLLLKVGNQLLRLYDTYGRVGLCIGESALGIELDMEMFLS